MKHFLKKIFVFTFLLLIPFFLLEFSIETSRDSFFKESSLEKNYKNDANGYAWINKLNNKPINIVSGSSTVRYGLSCKQLNELNQDSSVYINFAMDARDPIQTYFILKNVNLYNVKTVYFGLDPWIYGKKYYKHLHQSILYLDFTFFECLLYFKEHDKSAFSKRYKAYFDYISNSKKGNSLKNEIIPKDFGSIALEHTALNFSTLNDIFQTNKYGWSSLQFEYLKKIETLCDENKIKLNLFVVPKRSDYSKFHKNNFVKYHEEYLNKMAEISMKSPIFGKLDLLDSKGDSILFTEAFHLNKAGQVKFTKLFYELTLKPNQTYLTDYDWFVED